MIVWRRLLDLWGTQQACAKHEDNLLQIVNQARLDWLYAQNYYRTVTDPDLIDYSIFLTKAYERRYIYLLKKARQEGIYCRSGKNMSGITDMKTIRRLF